MGGEEKEHGAEAFCSYGSENVPLGKCVRFDPRVEGHLNPARALCY